MTKKIAQQKEGMTPMKALDQTFTPDYASAKRDSLCPFCTETDRAVVTLVAKYGPKVDICGSCAVSLHLALQQVAKMAIATHIMRKAGLDIVR